MSVTVTMSKGSPSYLDSLRIELKAILCDQELLNIFALIALELNHLAHFTVRDNGAIAGCHKLAVVDDGCIIPTYRISS